MENQMLPPISLTSEVINFENITLPGEIESIIPHGAFSSLNERNEYLTKALIVGLKETLSNAKLANDPYQSNETNQKQADDLSVNSSSASSFLSSACWSCGAPWIERMGLLKDGKHSRRCRSCKVSFCPECKHMYMIKTNEDMSPISSTNTLRKLEEETFDGSNIKSDNNNSNNNNNERILTSTSVLPSSTLSILPVQQHHKFDAQNAWLCRNCATEKGILLGKPCTSCGAPWMERNSLFGVHSKHSRECITCGRSYCHVCKLTHMVKTYPTSSETSERSSLVSLSRYSSLTSSSSSIHRTTSIVSSHVYECLFCRSDYMYDPHQLFETDHFNKNEKINNDITIDKSSSPSSLPKQQTKKNNFMNQSNSYSTNLNLNNSNMMIEENKDKDVKNMIKIEEFIDSPAHLSITPTTSLQSNHQPTANPDPSELAIGGSPVSPRRRTSL